MKLLTTRVKGEDLIHKTPTSYPLNVCFSACCTCALATLSYNRQNPLPIHFA